VLLYEPQSFMLPEPLAFPLAPYADALATHAKLLAMHQETLLAEPQRFGDDGAPFCFLSDYAGLVVARPTGVTADMVPRAQAVELTRNFHGISRALYLSPGAFHFRVLVHARSLVSLHTLEVVGAFEAATTTPRLRVVSHDDVVEPRKQKHREAGAWTITRWVAFDREARHAWRPTPTEPASMDETVDRFVALYDAPIHRRLEDYLRKGHSLAESFVYVRSTGRAGDSILALARANHGAVTWGHREIARALQETEHPEHVPVFVHTSGWAALRWIDPRAAGGGEAPPPGMTETFSLPFEMPALDEDEDDEDDDVPHEAPPVQPEAPPVQPAPAPARPRRAPTEAEITDEIFKLGLECEVDRLTRLTRAELDREIAQAGFDPEAERAFGPGLRERVVEAIMKQELAATTLH
jgi:hypothetical protein